MMKHAPQTRPTLVLGGTGKIGRRVVERLAARGRPVRVGSRSGEPRFDWDDRRTWDAVLEGVGSAYVSHYWDAIPGAADTLGSFAHLAVESGVPVSFCCPAAARKKPSGRSGPCATPAPS